MKFKKVKEKAEYVKVNSRCYKLISEQCKVLSQPNSVNSLDINRSVIIKICFLDQQYQKHLENKFSGCVPHRLNKKLQKCGTTIYALTGPSCMWICSLLKFENHWYTIMYQKDLLYPFDFSILVAPVNLLQYFLIEVQLINNIM